LRSIDGPLIEPRNDFRRDILDDSPPMVIVIRASAVLAPTMSMRLPPTLPCHRPVGWIRPNDHHEDARAVWQQTVGSAAMKFQVWACDLDGQEFDEDSSYTIHPVMTGVLTIHWADGRASHYSPAAWQRIEDQISGPVSGSGCDLRCPRGRVSRLAVAGDRVGWATTGSGGATTGSGGLRPGRPVNARECP